MIHTRHALTALTLLALSWPATALASQPCEPTMAAEYTPPPSTLEVSSDTEQICGLANQWTMLAHTFEITGDAISADAAQADQQYLLDYEDGRRGIWTPGNDLAQSWLIKDAASIRPVTLSVPPVTLSPTYTPHCYALPDLADEPHLVTRGKSLNRQFHWVSATLEVADHAAEPLPTPELENIGGQDAVNACHDHGLFVASMGDTPDGVWAYEWTVRDREGRVVQRGTGLQPQAVAQATEVDGHFRMSEFYGIGETQRPYHAGQTYEMEIRAVGFHGQRSEPASGDFVFDQTGEGRSIFRLEIVLIIVQLFLASGLGLPILLGWAIWRRRSS